MLKLRELRKKCGLTMKDLGEEIGVAESTISQYETGKRQPDYETLLKFGEFFGVSVDYLLTGEETKKAPTDEGERIPHRDKRELLAGRGVSILLDADAKLTDEQLDDIVNFIQFQQEKNGR